MPQNSPVTDSPARKVLRRKIEELQKKAHLPPEMVAVVSAVAQLQIAAEEEVRFAGLAEQALPDELLQKTAGADKRASGAPILSAEEFPLDTAAASRLARDLLGEIHARAPQLSVWAKELEQALESDPALLENACREVIGAGPADRASCLEQWEETHPEAPYFLRFIARSAALPSLAVAGRLLAGRHNKEAVWQHGHCPVCGSQPLMGRLEGKEGRRMHTCSFCSFEYRAPRMGCPFCLADEAGGSEYYVSEEEPGYLLNVCAACKNYIKLADFREYDRAWLPLLDDLASLTLDLYARQMGYTRPTLSGWGF